ncbi:MAG: DUF2752 domain-containing protein [Emergencia sp.]
MQRTYILKRFKIIFVICVIWGIYILFDIRCPIFTVFNIKCPTCGVTRALAALVHGNLSLYFQLQPFALPLTMIVFVCVVLKGLSEKMDKLINIFSLMVLVCNLGWCFCVNIWK